MIKEFLNGLKKKINKERCCSKPTAKLEKDVAYAEIKTRIILLFSQIIINLS